VGEVRCAAREPLRRKAATWTEVDSCTLAVALQQHAGDLK